jgi:hypothetical protein
LAIKSDSINQITKMKLLCLVLCICLAGCQAAQPKKKDSVTEGVSALGTVTEGLTNQNISKEDLKRLAVDVERDPKTKSAVQSINDALQVQQQGIKYCPKDGQRFASSVKECPIHHVELLFVE